MSGRLDVVELARVRWFLGQLLVLISFAGTYAIDLGAYMLVSAALAAVLMVTVFPVLSTSLPGLFRTLVPWLLLGYIVLDFFMSGGDILPPLFRMLLLLTTYRALRQRSGREDLQLLLLCLFLVLLTGVLSLEITFALQLLLFAPVSMALLFAVNLAGPSTEEPMEARTQPRPSWPLLLRRLGRQVDQSTLVLCAALFLFTSGATLVLFLLMPRFDIGAALPFPRLQAGQSLAGFSDRVRYRDVTDILADDRIAMRVDVSDSTPPARPYWRMVVLDAYTDGGFEVSPGLAEAFQRVNHFRFQFDHGAAGSTDLFREFTLYMEGGISAYLPAPDAFKTLRFNNRFDLEVNGLTRVLRGEATNATTLSFRYTGLGFEGVLPLAPEDRILTSMAGVAVEADDGTYLERMAYPQTQLAYPAGRENARILESTLRRLGRARGLPARDFSSELVAVLQEGRGYSLESQIPGGEADLLLRWLESGTPGHCELYAGAFVLLARYAGHPARLVTGFAGGDWNGFENYFMVRNRHAHAWCEVFSPDEGWIRVDPTPGGDVDAGSVEDALASGGLSLDRSFRAYLDSLRILWFRRVIQFDGEDQEVLAKTVQGLGAAGWNRLREAARAWWTEVKGRLGDEENRPGNLQAWLREGGVVLGLALLLWILWRLRHRLRGREQREARVRRWAGRLLRKYEGLKATAPQAHGALERIRYGPPESWPEPAETYLQRLPRRLRKQKLHD